MNLTWILAYFRSSLPLSKILETVIHVQYVNSLSSADNLCKQFGPRSGPIKHRTWTGSKLFYTLMVFFEKENQQMQNFPVGKKFIYTTANIWDFDTYCTSEISQWFLPFGKVRDNSRIESCLGCIRGITRCRHTMYQKAPFCLPELAYGK